MCDACLQLGTPWLPSLHGGRPRPRTRPQLQLARRTVKPVTKPAPSGNARPKR